MYASARQVAEFDHLTAPLMMSGSDLPQSIQRLETTARQAVSSLLGWSLTMKVSGANVTLTRQNTPEPMFPPGQVKQILSGKKD